MLLDDKTWAIKKCRAAAVAGLRTNRVNDMQQAMDKMQEEQKNKETETARVESRGRVAYHAIITLHGIWQADDDEEKKGLPLQSPNV